MKYIEIVRMRNNKNGIVGVMSINNDPECVTLEQAWNNNTPFASCIPAGLYELKRITSPTFGDTFEIQNVPGGRNHCIFHSGNTIADTRGCVLTGTYIGRLNGRLAILDSKKAYNKFLFAMGSDKEALLIISEPAIT